MQYGLLAHGSPAKAPTATKRNYLSGPPTQALWIFKLLLGHMLQMWKPWGEVSQQGSRLCGVTWQKKESHFMLQMGVSCSVGSSSLVLVSKRTVWYLLSACTSH